MSRIRQRSIAVALGFGLFLLGASLPPGSWQDEGHVLVNRVAAEGIPEEMPAFFRNAVDRLEYLGPEPDRWREESEVTLKSSQEPDHFINLDVLGSDFEFDRDRYDFYTKLYEWRAELASSGRDGDHLLPDRVGLQPYITIEIFDRLKVAFRQYRKLLGEGVPTELVEGNVILYAGWLGHYVADGAQPHHTSVHFDGWQGPNPEGYAGPGIHARFEADFVRRNVKAEDFSHLVGPPRYLEDPFADYLSFLRASHELTEELYRIDKAGGFEGVGTEGGQQFAQARLAAGSQMLLNLWYTAWLDAGEGTK